MTGDPVVNFNGLRTKFSTNKKAIFVALLPEAWRPIEGGCGCDYCKTHPDQTPMWDTLVVKPQPPRKGYNNDFTSTCHYPEFARCGARKDMRDGLV